MTGFWVHEDFTAAGQLKTEKQARQKAQAEVEKLKGVIVQADLVLQRAVLDEREACAEVCDVFGASDCAKHIRKRSLI